MKYFCSFLLAAILALTGCEKSSTNPVEPAEKQRGDIISSETIANISSVQIAFLIASAGITLNYSMTHDVKVVKVVYQSEDASGNKTELSGVIMQPENDNTFPLLSLQHGTVTNRDNVASVRPLETVEGITGLMMASIGYLTCLPDYHGYGESEQMHPYVHARSLSIAVIDMLRATRVWCDQYTITLNDQIFLTGYSEGGYASLAAQKEIETNYAEEFGLTAVAPMAGPYDMVLTAKSVLQQNNYDWPAYIAFLFTAYDQLYAWNRLNEIFNPPYASMMTSLFDGNQSFGQINNQLPSAIPDLISQNFITGILDGSETQVLNAFADNSLLDWSPQTPIRLFHGDADTAVPYQNALSARDSLRANNAIQIDLVTISGGTHESSGIECILGMLDWFQSFKIVQTAKLLQSDYLVKVQ